MLSLIAAVPGRTDGEIGEISERLEQTLGSRFSAEELKQGGCVLRAETLDEAKTAVQLVLRSGADYRIVDDDGAILAKGAAPTRDWSTNTILGTGAETLPKAPTAAGEANPSRAAKDKVSPAPKAASRSFDELLDLDSLSEEALVTLDGASSAPGLDDAAFAPPPSSAPASGFETPLPSDGSVAAASASLVNGPDSSATIAGFPPLPPPPSPSTPAAAQASVHSSKPLTQSQLAATLPPRTPQMSLIDQPTPVVGPSSHSSPALPSALPVAAPAAAVGFPPLDSSPALAGANGAFNAPAAEEDQELDLELVNLPSTLPSASSLPAIDAPLIDAPGSRVGPLPQAGPSALMPGAASAGSVGRMPAASRGSMAGAASASSSRLRAQRSASMRARAKKDHFVLFQGRLGQQPRVRIAIGFAMALAFGAILPMCHARSVVASRIEPARKELSRVNAYAPLLSSRPGYRNAEELTQHIASVQWRYGIQSFFLWIICAAGVGALWFKFT